MGIYLFGFLYDDFYGRVIVAPADQTVAGLAAQLVSWGPTPHDGQLCVTNEAGAVLDPAATLREAGLGNGDIFMVSAVESAVDA